MTYQINTPEDKWVTYTLNSVPYEMSPLHQNGVAVMMTEEEALARATEWQEWDNGSIERKLKEVRRIRTVLLNDTDYLASSDRTLSDAMKTWRQGLRDIPQNYTTEEEYDLLLERNEDAKGRKTSLKHEVWSKPE